MDLIFSPVLFPFLFVVLLYFQCPPCVAEVLGTVAEVPGTVAEVPGTVAEVPGTVAEVPGTYKQLDK